MNEPERLAYNAALAAGDAEEATRLGLLALDAIARRIMAQTIADHEATKERR